MKKAIILLVSLLSINLSFSQTPVTEKKIGHTFYISVPDYFTKTLDLNDDAVAQYESAVKDAYCFVIEDSKEDLELVNMKFVSLNDFYTYFEGEFLKDLKKRKIDKPTSFKNGETNYMQVDASYYSEESKIDIYYQVTLIETKNYFYKVYCYTALDNKAIQKADFEKMGASLHE
jgi:hypothetical protein